MTELALIAAIARNGVIGRGSELVFREPADQRRFRELTMGCPVIMGRKTWDSLPPRFRPLPGRRNLVLSGNPGWRGEGAEGMASFDAALARVAGAPRAFVIGGARLYALALPQAQQLLLTEVDADLDGDIHFPAWDRSQFSELSRSDERTAAGVAYHFVDYRRR